MSMHSTYGKVMSAETRYINTFDCGKPVIGFK